MIQSHRSRNRKLLVSVFNAQEAREAVLGGARIIDSEDPTTALGNISPRHIMAISDAVLDYTRDLEVQLSTNIGEDQLLYDRSDSGVALEKSVYEMAGKSAQAAIGVAAAMGTRVHPVNLVKVGVDGMPVETARSVIDEVVSTLKQLNEQRHCQVMVVLFAQDLGLWQERRTHPAIRRELIGHREFHAATAGSELTFDLLENDYLVKTLRGRDGTFLFPDPQSATSSTQVLARLKAENVLPGDANSTLVELNDLFPHARYFPGAGTATGRTNKDVIKLMVDVTADAGADAIMLDTSILTKVARISLVDTAGGGLMDANRYDSRDGLPRRGILTLEELRFFVEYCHFRGVAANLAGSLESFHAQQLWLLIPELDQLSTRGGSTAVAKNPSTSQSDSDTRYSRVTKRHLVRGLAPPELDGCLNIPARMVSTATRPFFETLRDMISDERRRQGYPIVPTYIVDQFGTPNPL